MPTRADWLLSEELAPSTGGQLAPLYAAAAQGRLALPFCGRCGLPLELEQQVCDGCEDRRVVWRATAARGAVHAVTVVHRPEPGLVLAAEPYVVADVELDGGHRLVLTSVRPLAHPPAIGDPVAIAFRQLGGVAVPAFDPIPPDPHPEAPR